MSGNSVHTMTEGPKHGIKPDLIRTPISLQAAMVVALIVVDGAFLTAAGLITVPNWAPGVLVVAAVVNVFVFVGAIFLLQTKFRPETQSDEYYAQHLQLERDEHQVGLRLDNLLAAIDKLDERKAIELGNNSPIKSETIDEIIESRDPNAQRMTDGEIAKEMLKMRVALSKRSKKDLDTWEAAMRATE